MRVTTARRFGDCGRLRLLALCFVAPAALASQIIPAGGTAILHAGFYHLACTDLTVGGVLDIGTGRYVNVSNLTVGASGIIQGTGTIRYSGKLSVGGTIQGTVNLVVNPPSNAACPGPPPSVIGNVVNPAPALGNSMLVALAMLVMVLAIFALRGQAALRCSSEKNGAKT